ncbi:acyltransferase family protein [Thalassotalea litorea]|uniref:acyltransferase family protein n=1 Tax=Thalassotalea litorea TaxID=2020715 RepID=UPI0037366CBE
MSQENYLGYVHSFRGFAILNVVAIHAIAFALLIPMDWQLDTTNPMVMLNELLFHDATLFFALISGLLFSSILRARGYPSFYKSKVINVLLPYIFCTLVFTMMRWNASNTGLTLPDDAADYFTAILPNLIKGEAQFTFWYIPLLLILFILTPLLNKLTLLRSYSAAWVWLVMLLPLIFSRPEFSPETSQINAGAVIYFSGAYTVGIFLGNDLENLLNKLARFRFYLIMTVIVSSAAIAWLMYNEINRFGYFSLQESLFYLQKLSMATLVLLWLRNRGEKQPYWLKIFANEAFSIYFLHAFFISLLGMHFWDFQHITDYQPWTMYFFGVANFVFSLAMSMIVVWLLRKMFGRRSRMLVGS